MALVLSGSPQLGNTSNPESLCADGPQMRFGVGADIGEAGGIGHARSLARFGAGPAFALLEFHGVIVEEFIDRHRWQRKGQ